MEYVHLSIYQEHLEASSSLYEQQITLFDDPEITWQDHADFEQRFEAHIDGLVVGEDLALDVCKQQAAEGDFGELHAAVRVFCRQNRLDLVKEVLEKLDPEDNEKVQAVSDALNHELPQAWQDEFIRMLSEGDEKLRPIIAKLIGYRRLNGGAALLQALQKSPPDALPTILWSIGRLKDRNARTLLFNNYLQHENEGVRAATALTLMRFGDLQSNQFCMRAAQSQSWAHIPLGLAGGQSAVRFLLGPVSGKAVAPDCLLALGLLGDVSTVGPLLSQLGNAELAEASARGLNLITGAELYEQVFIPEPIDEDELFEEEKEKLKRGEPLFPPGKEPGTTISRLSQKPDDWQKWWSQNKSRFNPQVRYRNGKPYSPACLLENLESDKSPRQVRQLAYEELVIRYGADFPLETDMFVVEQKLMLAKYAEWIKANGGRFREGKWYFAGQTIT